MLLAIFLVSAIACPAAWASPEGESIQQYGQPPMWGSCEQFIGDARAIPTAQCGTVSVPVDYTKPEGAQAQLAVIRIPASGDRIGVLVVNPGGPGASAVDTVASMGASLADTDIPRRFDLVGIDPRGVGHSTPELRCRTDAEFDAFRREPMADYSPEGVAHIEAVWGQFAYACVQRMGTEFLANVGTASSARTWTSCAPRSARTKSTISVSRTEPNSARPMPSDTPTGCARWCSTAPSTPAWTRSPPASARWRASKRLSTTTPPTARQSAGCPLGTDPAKFVDRYHELVDPLVNKPGGTSDPRGLSYQDAMTGTVNALYSRRYWQYLTSGLLGLQRGTDAGDLLLLADDYQHRDSSGHYKNLQDAFTAIRCVDAPYPTDPAVWADADRQIREVAPFMEYGNFTGFAPRDVCAMWPVPPTSTPQPAASPGPARSSSSPPRTIRPPRMRQAWIWPVRWAPD